MPIKQQNGFLRQTVLVLAALVFVSACISPRKTDKWVANHYGSVPAPVKKKNELVTVQSTVASMGSVLSESRRKSASLLPLLVYWKWNYVNACKLNPQMALNGFTTTVNSYAARVLKPKLSNQSIVLTVEKIPSAFDLDDTGHYIFFGIYGFGWETVTLVPQEHALQVSYQVLNADQSIAKTGTVTMPISIEPVKAKLYQSVKKKMELYLEQYDAAMLQMGRKLIDKLATEL
ncbi:hypothetical protein IQ13_1128 [Lacibacter cauensis]|uniref:Uncharacterized protein n=1 Tax=Lacibacter cauensis TaxID=510947 RepID=A0A562SP33_9BACT|nr:hypothetical protein [Lacibacter cauensis]TWI83022.1 hypothetical protein IQ13_1128 [Lacibacter cauensis]